MNTIRIPLHILLGRLRGAILAVLLSLLLPVHSHAGVTEAWVQRYSVLGDSTDKAYKVLRDPAGDFLVVGATVSVSNVQGLLIIKYSGVDGSVLWQRSYDGPAPTLFSLDPAVFVLGAVVDASGNLVLTTRAHDTNHFFDYYTAKYAAADGTLLWERRYDGPAHGSDVPAAVAVDGSGNVVVTGFSKVGMDEWFLSTPFPMDFYTAKYAAADGALLWEKRYDGPAGGWDFATAVAVDPSGDVVVTGGSYNEYDNDGQPLDCDFFTAKYAAADGALLWEKRYSGPGGRDDTARAVAVDASGNVVVTGESYGLGSWYDYYTVKYAAADGVLLWEQRYDGPAHDDDFPTAVVVDASGDVVVTGHSYAGPNSGDYTVKYAAANGVLLWEVRDDGPSNSYELALAVDARGNVMVTGYSYDLGSHYDFYTAKYGAANGALLWEIRYNGPTNGDDIAMGIALDASGDVVVTGYSNHDFHTARYAAVNGALLWEQRYGGQTKLGGEAQAVAVDTGGNVVVTGYSYNGTNSDYYTAKYAAADGALLWDKRYNGPANGDDRPVALGMDASGNVVATGGSAGTGAYTAKYAAVDGGLLWEQGSSFSVADMAVDASGNVVVAGTSSDDYYTAKYAAATGALLWDKRYQGPLDAVDGAVAVAVDASGDVVVTGSSEHSGFDTNADYYTAKYAAATGALLWEKRYNGPTNGGDGPAALAIDASGDVVVTGYSTSNDYPYDTDFYTAKYAAATGALLWEKRYNSPGELSRAQSVAVDASGDVAVTGYIQPSSGIGTHTDSYTAKYAAATGALLWEKRYNGPANGDDRARAVALDASGNVVMTGYSVGNNSGRDYYTAAYAAADGALLWEKRYNGPANGNEYVVGPHSLALGPDGMVAITGTSVSDYATVVYRQSPPPASFTAWVLCFGLAGSAAAADADPDRDGLPNGVEYILGGNPAAPDTSGRPVVAMSGGNLVLTFPRDDSSETPDVTLTLESGTDLVTWPTAFTVGPTTAASSPGVSISENGTAPDTITVTIPVGTDKARFARLRATIAP